MTIFHRDPPKISLEQLWISVWQCGKLFQSSLPMADTHSSHSCSRKALFSLKSEKKPNRGLIITCINSCYCLSEWGVDGSLWYPEPGLSARIASPGTSRSSGVHVESPAPRQGNHTHSLRAEAQLQLWAVLEGFSALPHLAELPLLLI